MMQCIWQVAAQPDEYSNFEDVFLGVNVLTKCLGKLANQ